MGVVRLGYVAPPANPYSTTFPLTENPMVEDGNWLYANSYHQKFRTGSGRAYGVGPVISAYEDCLALRRGVSTTAHYARGVLYWAGGYSPAVNHEIELIVAGSYGASFPSLYEFLMSGSGNFQIMRWGPAFEEYQAISYSNQNGGPGGFSDGMEMEGRFEVISGDARLRFYQNGVLKAEGTDSSAGKFVSGQPGVGAFAAPDASIVMENYCWASFTCGDL